MQITRASQEAWNTGDMDALREFYDPGAIMRPPEGWPESEPFVGRDSVMRQFEQLRSTWDADTVEWIGDPVDVGDRVVVRTSWDVVGQGPGVNFEVTQVLTVRKGRIVYLEFFWDHAEALEAVGLSEQDAHADS